jgi:hypothetical protein
MFSQPQQYFTTTQELRCSHCDLDISIGDVAVETHIEVRIGAMGMGQRSGRPMVEDTEQTEIRRFDYVGHAECFPEALLQWVADNVVDWTCGGCGECIYCMYEGMHTEALCANCEEKLRG